MTRLMLILLLPVALLGCRGVSQPQTRVLDVAVSEQTAQGARIEMTVAVENRSDVPLPVRSARYEVQVEELGSFAFRELPAVTLPPNGTQTFTLAAAFADGQTSLAGRRYDVTGRLAYEPPGEVRSLLTEYGVPLPAVSFDAQGRLESPPPQ